MKVAEIVAAFQRFAATRNDAEEPQEAEARPPRPAVAQTLPQRSPAETDDLISVSPEAIFTFAASRFDPERITREEIESLAETLHRGGAISPRDRTILSAPPEGGTQRAMFGADPDAPTNLVSEFQGRLAVDMANSDIQAVEADTRALSILGRLASIREELG